MEKQTQGEQSHHRRVRYKGTHPRKYSEKYKELNPEKYKDTVEKVIQKGSTPAGMHIPICVKEILDFLQIQPGMKGVDATLGYGGHSREMLKCLDGQGHLYALDVDPIEIIKTKSRLNDLGYGEDILTVLHRNFLHVDEVAQEYGPFQFLLADLGVSSMQIDNPERGFSYKNEGPLDLRLNPRAGVSAAERLREMGRDELTWMLKENSDEPYAQEIARAVISERRKGRKIETTTRLAEVVAGALSFLPENERKDTVKKSCARVFQALRIDVNSEFEVLEAFLEKLPLVMAPGGRIAILTFHSGEDRLVKKSFKELRRAGIYSDVAAEVIRPSAEECARNSRAKSAKLRWAVRAADFYATGWEAFRIHS
ncbi:MAG: 16S rRNA (cytosine(1402)-N(4))-methyltransferase RsmH [Lachnospiraceae bacterium]|nr:16S rRNA (cytosine(1402)-N(4))-methyltransferase RsmH [Lachnospiraceae bacterium]